jgi:hypothetical protein
MFAVPLTFTVAVVLPVTPLSVAEIVVVPPPCPAASPPDEMVATEVFDELQVALDVTLAVVLLLYVAVAVNCCVEPLAMLGAVGETEIEVTVKVAAVTVSVAVAVNPSAAALMVEVPAATAVARPVELTVAAVVFDDVHVTPEVSAPVVPLL